VPSVLGPASRRWIKVGSLKYGAHLRTPSGTPAVALGGHAPTVTSGWMWDLTITPSHDFYVIPAVPAGQVTDSNHVGYYVAGEFTPILVHNCNPAADFNVPSKPGVYTVHTYAGDKYVGESTWSMRGGVADALSPNHAFTKAGYTCEDICKRYLDRATPWRNGYYRSPSRTDRDGRMEESRLPATE
jgi:hypothetical protein